jgi:hypothetical protein
VLSLLHTCVPGREGANDKLFLMMATRTIEAGEVLVPPARHINALNGGFDLDFIQLLPSSDRSVEGESYDATGDDMCSLWSITRIPGGRVLTQFWLRPAEDGDPALVEEAPGERFGLKGLQVRVCADSGRIVGAPVVCEELRRVTALSVDTEGPARGRFVRIIDHSCAEEANVKLNPRFDRILPCGSVPVEIVSLRDLATLEELRALREGCFARSRVRHSWGVAPTRLYCAFLPTLSDANSTAYPKQEMDPHHIGKRAIQRGGSVTPEEIFNIGGWLESHTDWAEIKAILPMDPNEELDPGLNMSNKERRRLTEFRRTLNSGRLPDVPVLVWYDYISNDESGFALVEWRHIRTANQAVHVIDLDIYLGC